VTASPPRVGNSSSFLIVPCFFLGTKELEVALNDPSEEVIPVPESPEPVVGNWNGFDPV
jgi:hypothetical protein